MKRQMRQVSHEGLFCGAFRLSRVSLTSAFPSDSKIRFILWTFQSVWSRHSKDFTWTTTNSSELAVQPRLLKADDNIQTMLTMKFVNNWRNIIVALSFDHKGFVIHTRHIVLRSKLSTYEHRNTFKRISHQLRKTHRPATISCPNKRALNFSAKNIDYISWDPSLYMMKQPCTSIYKLLTLLS